MCAVYNYQLFITIATNFNIPFRKDLCFMEAKHLSAPQLELNDNRAIHVLVNTHTYRGVDLYVYDMHCTCNTNQQYLKGT